jgi:phosphate starvation-inducible protein PhoH
MLYGNLKSQETIKFWSTSFLRGTTLDNAIIIVDEFQNLSGHELDSIITRVGENSKIMFCGDATQSDLTRTSEKNGIMDFMKIIRAMPSFDIIEFGVEDICRSSLVKEYLIAKYSLNLDLPSSVFPYFLKFSNIGCNSVLKNSWLSGESLSL